jgi:hypothetical protein
VTGFFSRFERTAWRLETHPFYRPDAAEFARYQAGQPPTSDQQAQRQQWLAGLTSAVQTVGRVLVVAFPLDPYWQWRVTTAAAHLAAGEDIRLADRRGHPELSSLGDFWLLDDRLVLALDFDPDGGFLASRPITDPTLVDQYRRQLVLARSWSTSLAGMVRAAG